nr:hypothetical protein [Catenibacterium mitsuokai]
MEKRRNRNTDNEITKYIKYFIVETEDKSLKNPHAYARYRILKGAKDNEFMKKVSKRTNKNQSDIIKECSLYFVELHSRIKKKINSLSDKEYFEILNDQKLLDKIVTEINEEDKKEFANDTFL